MFSWLTGFFTNPALLGGAFAGSIPIIIHLLNKQKYKKMVWAAMHWLWAAQKKSQRRLLIEQLILLIIRVLILVLLAMTLARPSLQEGVGLISGRASVHRVLLIDNSYSMGLVVNGKTLFDKAKERAAQLVEGLSGSDDLDVYLVNAGVEELPRGSSINRMEILTDIKAAKLSDAGSNIPRGIAAACARILERHSHNARKEIVILSDTTRGGWMNAGGSGPKRLETNEEKAIKDVFDDIKTKPKIFVARLSGGTSRENLAIGGLEVEERVVPLGVETQLDATVYNFGVNAQKEVPVELFVDGERAGREVLASVEPGKPASVFFRHTFTNPGSHALHVSIVKSGADNLPVDDSAYLALDAEEQVKVLCVDGQQNPTPNMSDLDFFRQALSPAKAAELNAGKMPLQPEVIGDGAFPDANLDEFRLVVLANIAIIPPEKIAVMEQYVRRGGALWIWLGERIDPAIYNKDLNNILPANIGELVGEGKEDGPSDKLSDKDLDHPAMVRFKDIKGISMNELQVFRRYKLAPKPTKDGHTVRTVFSYENGDPAAVEWNIGDGHVLLIGTTADRDWTNWPKKKHYMPMINFLALDMIQPAHVQRNRIVGEPFAYGLLKEELGAARREGLQLKDPGNELLQMEVQAESFRALSKPTRRAGIYQMEIPGEKRRMVHFAVNRNLEESDLDIIDDKDLLAMLPSQAGQKPALGAMFDAPVLQSDVELTDGEPGQLEAAIKKHQAGREIWRYLAMAVLFLLLLESFLARRFGNYKA